MRTPIFVRRVSRQIRDIAGGEDPVGGAVNRDLQGLVGEGGLAQHKKHDTSLDVYFKLKMVTLVTEIKTDKQ